MDVFWQEDFSGGIIGLNDRWYNRAFNWDDTPISNARVDELWQIGDTNNIPQFVNTYNSQSGVRYNPLSIIKSDTVENGYLYFDSDTLGTTYSSVVELESKNSIDLTGKTTVYFRLFFHLRKFMDGLYIGISIDNGATYIDLFSYMQINFGEFINVNNTTIPNNRMTFNISDIVANQSQVKIKMRYTHAYDWGIMIDDMLLYEPLPLTGAFSDNSVKLLNINNNTKLYFKQEVNAIDGINYTHKLFIYTSDFDRPSSYITNDNETRVALISETDFNTKLNNNNMISDTAIDLEYYNNQNKKYFFGIDNVYGYLYFKNDDMNAMKLLFKQLSGSYSNTNVLLASINNSNTLELNEEINTINGVTYTHSVSISTDDLSNYNSGCYVTSLPINIGYACIASNIPYLISNNPVTCIIKDDLVNASFFGISGVGKLYFKNDDINSIRTLFIQDNINPPGPQPFSSGNVILFNYINNYEKVLYPEENIINGIIYTHKANITNDDINYLVGNSVFSNDIYDKFAIIATNDLTNLSNGALISGNPVNLELYVSDVNAFGIARAGTIYFKNDDIASMKALFIEDYVPPPGPEQFSYDNVKLNNDTTEFSVIFQQEENIINDIIYTHKLVINESDIANLSDPSCYFSNDDYSRIAIISENDFNNALDANYALTSDTVINLEQYIDQTIYKFAIGSAGTLYFRNTDMASMIALFIATPPPEPEPEPEPQPQEQYVKKYNIVYGRYIIDSEGALDENSYPIYITKTRFRLVGT